MKPVLDAIETALELTGLLVENIMVIIGHGERWVRAETESFGISSGTESAVVVVAAIFLVTAAANVFQGVYRFIVVATILLIVGHFVIHTINT